MMQSDPYAPPASSAGLASPYGTSDAVTQGVLEQLRRTKPWVRFMSVLVFIGAAIMLLMAVVMLVAGSNLAAMSTMGNQAFGGLGMGIFAAVYAVIAFVYIYPGIALWKYASRIGALLMSNSAVDLEAALNEQRKFWKFLGVLAIIFMALYAFGIVAVMIMGVAGVMNAG